MHVIPKERIGVPVCSLLLTLLGGGAIDLARGDVLPQNQRSTTPFGLCGQNMMQKVEVLPGAATPWHIDTKSRGLDLDQDGLAEFVRSKQLVTNFSFDVFESVADNTFVSVYLLDLAATFSDAGDVDEDGLSDMLITNHIDGDTFIRVYESPTTNSYPDQIVWEFVVDAGIARFGDTDGDGVQEIINFGRPESSQDYHLMVFENSGDNSFEASFDELLPGVIGGMEMAVAEDLDGDGRGEILVGGSISGNGKSLIVYESTGDNAYSWAWSQPLTHGGEQLNPKRIVDAGDLDGDGKNEFLVGGLRANSAPTLLVFYLFEAVDDNEFQIVFTFEAPYGTLESIARAAVADVDGDGNREVVLGSGSDVRVYGNDGDNAWSEIWSTTTDNVLSLGVGDHDSDGKDELIIGGGFWPNGETAIWEIRPTCAADIDGDSVVDVIDNCPSTSNPNQDDADSDDVGDLCDNCVYAANTSQSIAVLGQEIVALDQVTFGWSVDAEVEYVRGDLALVDSYTTDVNQVLALGATLVDADLPLTDEGFYYLVKPDCAVGSWQSTLDAEPGRDAALP